MNRYYVLRGSVFFFFLSILFLANGAEDSSVAMQCLTDALHQLTIIAEKQHLEGQGWRDLSAEDVAKKIIEDIKGSADILVAEAKYQEESDEEKKTVEALLVASISDIFSKHLYRLLPGETLDKVSKIIKADTSFEKYPFVKETIIKQLVRRKRW